MRSSEIPLNWKIWSRSTNWIADGMLAKNWPSEASGGSARLVARM